LTPSDSVRTAFLSASQAFLILSNQSDLVASAAQLCIDTLKRGNKILLCGNGGSAADCQHIAAELTGWFKDRSRKPLAAIALTTDSSALTAIGNDSDFCAVFARQVEALGRPGDLLIAISTSGNSENVVAAVAAAFELGMATIALAGRSGGRLAERATILIPAPSDETPRIQEMHIAIGHAICALIDEAFA
jgi:D-sedoheptulose 7-phosphate isomerase